MLYLQSHSFYSVPILFKMRFRAGRESNVNYIPSQFPYIVCVACLTLNCSCKSSVEWVWIEVPSQCFPAIYNSCKLFEWITTWYVLWGQIISFMYCDCYSILSSFLLTRNKGVACILKLNGVQKSSFSFWERHLLSAGNAIINCTVINGVLVFKIFLSQCMK